MGLNVDHFRNGVVLPTLEALGLWSDAAEELVIGTAATESLLYHLRQHPAVGR